MKTVPIIITSLCKFNCKYCEIKKIENMSLSEFKAKIDKEIKNNKNLKKAYITGGDPELNKDFFEMCKYVKNKSLKLKISGIYAKENLRKYVGVVDEASVALDSLKEKLNDYFRGEGSYALSVNAIKFFIKNKIRVQIHTVANSKNINELKKTYGGLHKKGFFEKNSWKIFRFTTNKNNKEYLLSDKEWNEIKKINNKIIFINKFEDL